MEMPKPSADHQRLEQLAGVWNGTEKMHPSQWDPTGSEAQGTTRGRVALGGFNVIVDYEQLCGGQRTFEGHGVYSWDAQARQVVLHWFDSTGMGVVDEFRGSWEGEILTLACRNQMGHWGLTYDHSQPGTLLSCMETSQDGQDWAKMFDGRYTRQD